MNLRGNPNEPTPALCGGDTVSDKTLNRTFTERVAELQALIARVRQLKRFPLRLLISMLKGGAGKTTATWFLALVFAALGLRVVTVDADLGSRSLSEWHDDAVAAGNKVPFTVLVWRSTNEDGELSDFLTAKEAEHQPDVMICDIGGERREVFMSACLWCDRLLSPCSPSEIEIKRLHETKKFATSVAKYSPLFMSVLLNEVPVIGKGLAAEARALISGEVPNAANRQQPYALGVMDTEISLNRHRYSVTYGAVGTDYGEFVDLAEELLLELLEEEES